MRDELRMSIQLLISQTIVALYAGPQACHANDMALVGNTVRLAAIAAGRPDVVMLADQWNRAAVCIHAHASRRCSGHALTPEQRDGLGHLGCELANWLNSQTELDVQRAHAMAIGYVPKRLAQAPLHQAAGRHETGIRRPGNGNPSSRSSHAA